MDNAALLLIDVQQGFDNPSWGTRNNRDAEENIISLLQLWREKGGEVIHVQHCSLEEGSPLREGQPGCEFKPEVLPLSEEKVFKKNVNSAFIGTGLEDYLHKLKISSLVIVGLTTDHCVSTTTRMAGNLGFKAFLVEDATATFDRRDKNGKHFSAEEIHQVHLASLHNEFCEVVTTEKIQETLLIITEDR